MQTNINIKKFHDISYKGILKIVKSRKDEYSRPLIWCLIITIVITIILNIFDVDTYELVKSFAELSITIFSSLLGFSIGGYALIIGFSNNSLLAKTSKTDRYSTYQVLIGFFAYTLIIQLITVAVSFTIKLISSQNIKEITNDFTSKTINIINSVGFSVILLLSIYSVILSYFIVTNLFTLGQLNNYFFTLEKLEGSEKKEKKIEKNNEPR